MAGGARVARRTPFVLLVVALLGSGLIALLLLNSSLNQGSFELSRLEKQTSELSDERQALQQEVDRLSAPDALERRARELGMVPGGNPAFLNPDGSVSGAPAPASGGPSVYRAPASPLPSLPAASPSAQASAPGPTAVPQSSAAPTGAADASQASPAPLAAPSAEAAATTTAPGAAPSANSTPAPGR
ncbi:septum formation initiator family protein [Streptomyces sp. ME19-01-6]|uniref:FtsB family cell division protein n=1 Tax=Streptomyces sp. ME19-01-6 TaxID=3028686 RepID=UPI0029A6C1D8|nr:septum formation initiator family protein [Streptomyces sp. ME19-01-6]MDX3232085.1 septum formation initiator family protein [Streptomyces sp. ME19-01-6]